MSTGNYWLDLAQYNLETAEVVLLSQRYLYVGFMCHQSIEKILKAIYSKKYNEVPPRTHNLSTQIKYAELAEQIPGELLDVIHQLNPLYIATRYLDDELNIMAELTQEYATQILSATRRLFAWLQTTL